MPDPSTGLTDHVVVCGLDHLGLRTIQELRLGDAPVLGVGTEDEVERARERLDGVPLLVGDPRRETTLHEAGVERAAALVLTGESDQGNLDAALAAQESNADLRIVLRMFDSELASHIEALFPNAVALSSSALAAPGFVSAALDGDGGASFLLAGHRLRSRLSGGADGPDGGPGPSGPDDGPNGRFHDPLKTFEIARLHTDRTVDLMPATHGATPVVLADGERRLLIDVARTYVAGDRHDSGLLGQAQRTTGAVLASVSGAAAEVGGGIRSLPGRMRAAIGRPRRLQPERRVVRLATILIALAIVSALYFQITARLSPLDAFSYAITLLTGAALPTSLDPAAVGVPLKVYAIVLSVVGAAIVAVVYALITDAIVRSRLLQTFGRRSVPASISEHVIVAGLGSIGYRVALDLAARGVPVVVADIAEDGRFTAATRAAGIPVAVGDARHPEILADLGLDRARAVIAATSDDLVNIAIALNARAVRPEMRVVVRIFDPDFALRVQRGFRIRFTRSVSHLAAPAFAAAAIGSEVVATVPVGDRRVMLFARVPVTDGSALAGVPIGGLDLAGERSILAIDGPGDDDAEWLPGPEDVARPGDELIVAATRAGLARLLERSRARSPEPDPTSGGAPA